MSTFLFLLSFHLFGKYNWNSYHVYCVQYLGVCLLSVFIHAPKHTHVRTCTHIFFTLPYSLYYVTCLPQFTISIYFELFPIYLKKDDNKDGVIHVTCVKIFKFHHVLNHALFYSRYYFVTTLYYFLCRIKREVT